MLPSHSLSSFKNGCFAAPRHASSRRPMSAIERAPQGDEHVDHNHDKGYEPGVESVQQALNSRPLSSVYRQETTGLAHVLTTNGVYRSKEELERLLKDDDEFFSYLQDLKQESKRTLGMLERLYNRERSPDSEIGRDENQPRHHEEMKEHRHNIDDVTCSLGRIQMQYSDDYHSSSDALTDSEESDVPKLDANNQLNILPDGGLNFRGRPSSYDLINNMWSDFTMKGNRERIATPPRQSKINTWTPTTTIPKPFDMAKREAVIRKRNEKRRERLLRELEKKHLEEEEELRKKFKANPLPPSTSLPLYDAIRVKDERRRQHVKYLSKEILKATEKPFSFVKREEMKKEMQKSQAFAEMPQQKKDTTASLANQFKAKPFPEQLFGLTLADTLAEQDEYRKIRMQMRSEELLAKSSLPQGMADRLNAKKTKKRPRKKTVKSFSPSINQHIPDFEELQKKFELELRTRRTANALTICEPFNLHAAKVPTSRKTDELPLHGKTHPPKRKASNKQLQRMAGSLDKSMSYSMTEATRLRENAIRHKFDEKQKEEYVQHAKISKQKEKRKQLQQQIYKKSQMNDLSLSMDDHSLEKTREFQKAEKSRQKEYRRYLKELEERVEHRPLLFEQESQTNARRRVEQKYEDVLKQSGIGKDMLRRLMTDTADTLSDSETGSGDRSHSNTILSVTYDNTRNDSDDESNGDYISGDGSEASEGIYRRDSDSIGSAIDANDEA